MYIDQTSTASGRSRLAHRRIIHYICPPWHQPLDGKAGPIHLQIKAGSPHLPDVPAEVVSGRSIPVLEDVRGLGRGAGAGCWMLDLEGVRTLVALGWVAAGFLYEIDGGWEWVDVELLAKLGGFEPHN